MGTPWADGRRRDRVVVISFLISIVLGGGHNLGRKLLESARLIAARACQDILWFMDWRAVGIPARSTRVAPPFSAPSPRRHRTFYIGYVYMAHAVDETPK